MLNFGSKPTYDASLRKIAIWGADLVLCSAPNLDPALGVAMGVEGVYPSMWDVKVDSGPR